LALFQGLMDTDGCVDKRKNVCEFTNTNKQLIDGFIELALGLGIVVVVKEGRSRLNGKDCGPKWRVRFTPPLQPFRLPRKADKLSFDGPRHSRHRLRYVIGVDPAGEAPVRCIGVDSSSRLYLAGRSYRRRSPSTRP